MEEITWSAGWLASLLWLLRTSTLTLIGFTLIVWLLIRRARWGRQLWPVRPVLLPAPPDPSRLATAAGGGVAAAVRADVRAAEYSVALPGPRDVHGPAGARRRGLRSIAIFAVLATINVLLVLINFCIAQRQIINWRLWLNERIFAGWLDGAAYHRSAT